jgi:hypothetical protein
MNPLRMSHWRDPPPGGEGMLVTEGTVPLLLSTMITAMVPPQQIDIMVPYQIMNTQTLDMVTKISTIAIRDLV